MSTKTLHIKIPEALYDKLVKRQASFQKKGRVRVSLSAIVRGALEDGLLVGIRK